MLALPAPNGENKDKDREEKPSLLEDIARCISSLGSMQAQVVNLLQEVDHWKQKATALEGEKKGSSGNTSKLQKQIDTLTDQLKFERNLRKLRPRKPDWNPMVNPRLIRRILSHKDWTRLELSKLSCINAVWRKVCQDILFARLEEVFLFDRDGTEALFDFLKDKPHMASILKTVNMTYKKPNYKQLQSLTDAVPECILSMLPMCSTLTNLKCVDLAAVVATPKLLLPLKGKLQSLILDPQGNAGMCSRPMVFGPEPHALFADWPNLRSLSVSRRGITVYDNKETPVTVALETVKFTQCILDGKLSKMLEGSAKSLQVLELQAIGGVVLDDILQLLDNCGPSLQRLVYRSCRYMHDYTDRSFDDIFAKCQQLEHLNLDLSLLPVHSPGTFLSHQPRMRELELKKADWASLEDWHKLLGAVSKDIRSVTLIGANWSASDFARLEDEWKWRGVHDVNFVSRPRADYFGSFAGEMPMGALGWR